MERREENKHVERSVGVDDLHSHRKRKRERERDPFRAAERGNFLISIWLNKL
jgi:hypothetical protein